MFSQRVRSPLALVCVLVPTIACTSSSAADTATSEADFTACSVPSTGVITVDTTWSNCTATLTNVKVAAGATLHIASSKLYYDDHASPPEHLLDVEGRLDVQDTVWVPASYDQVDHESYDYSHPRWYRGELFKIALHASDNRFEHVTFGLGMRVDFLGSSNNVLHDVTVDTALDPNRGEHPGEATAVPVLLSFDGGTGNRLEHVRAKRDGRIAVAVADAALVVDDASLGGAGSTACVAATGTADVTVRRSVLGGCTAGVSSSAKTVRVQDSVIFYNQVGIQTIGDPGAPPETTCRDFVQPLTCPVSTGSAHDDEEVARELQLEADGDPLVERSLIFENDIGVRFGSTATMRVIQSTVSRNRGSALLVTANEVNADTLVQDSNLHENSLEVPCPGPGPRRWCQATFYPWARGTLNARENYWGRDRRPWADDPYAAEAGATKWNSSSTAISCAASSDPALRLRNGCMCEHVCNAAVGASVDNSGSVATPFPLLPMSGLADDLNDVWQTAWDLAGEDVTRAFPP